MESKYVDTLVQASQEYSNNSHHIDGSGEAMILIDHHQKYIDLEEKNDYSPELTDDKKIDIVARRILEKYMGAFKKLAEQ